MSASLDYLVILCRGEIDRFRHHDLFADEMIPAFERRGWKALRLDYMAQTKEVFAALQDTNCRFFVTFNGFGTELEMPTIDAGRLAPAFEAFGKPVFDLMHDCPWHESMSHQLHATYAARRLFITDYRYAGMAMELGVRAVRYTPSITFPQAAQAWRDNAPRDVDLLLAAGFQSPDHTRGRYEPKDIKGRLFQHLFEQIVAACGDDWSLDPAAELQRELAQLGIRLHGPDVDHRFLLTTILDFVKFDRRLAMLEALRGLPLTLVPDRPLDAGRLWNEAKVLEARSARELLQLMARSRIVVCPTTHMTGFHERPLGAFSVGAAVVSTPCIPLQTHFSDGRDAVFARNPGELRQRIEKLLADPELSRRIGDAGRVKAHGFLHPDRLIDTMLNAL